MPAQMIPSPCSQAGRSSGKPASWRDAYPILLGCLIEDRAPSNEEVERLAARMAREIGAGADPAWSRAGPDSVYRRQLLAAAEAALPGRRSPLNPLPHFPLVLHGH